MKLNQTKNQLGEFNPDNDNFILVNQGENPQNFFIDELYEISESYRTEQSEQNLLSFIRVGLIEILIHEYSYNLLLFF